MSSEVLERNARQQQTVDRLLEAGTIRFVALRDIEAGEEVTTNYNGNPDSQEPVWFDVQ